jgi:hypothetical protein
VRYVAALPHCLPFSAQQLRKLALSRALAHILTAARHHVLMTSHADVALAIQRLRANPLIVLLGEQLASLDGTRGYGEVLSSTAHSTTLSVWRIAPRVRSGPGIRALNASSLLFENFHPTSGAPDPRFDTCGILVRGLHRSACFAATE